MIEYIEPHEAFYHLRQEFESRVRSHRAERDLDMHPEIIESEAGIEFERFLDFMVDFYYRMK